MNSKGLGITPDMRVANPVLRVMDRFNEENANAVNNSMSVQPRANQITSYGEGNPELHRGKMNDVDYTSQDRDEQLRRAATTVAPVRRQNLLSNQTTTLHAVPGWNAFPNDFNRSITGTRV